MVHLSAAVALAVSSHTGADGSAGSAGSAGVAGATGAAGSSAAPARDQRPRAAAQQLSPHLLFQVWYGCSSGPEPSGLGSAEPALVPPQHLRAPSPSPRAPWPGPALRQQGPRWV